MSAEIVALVVLLGGVVAAVVFTIIVVVAVDRSDASAQRGIVREREEGGSQRA